MNHPHGQAAEFHPTLSLAEYEKARWNGLGSALFQSAFLSSSAELVPGSQDRVESP